MGGTGQRLEKEKLCRRSAASESINLIIPRQIEQLDAWGRCNSVQRRWDFGSYEK